MQADRKMEPWMLRDLADLWVRLWSDHGLLSWDRFLNEEAARREAEAKELGRATAEPEGPQGERKGPGSAAADMLYAVHIDPFKPVGFTLADVRKLAEWANRAYEGYMFGVFPAALYPFLPLLKETRDGE